MSDLIWMLIMGIAVGIFVGMVWSWHLFLRTEKPTMQYVVTPETLVNMNDAIVLAYLDARGLTWMPKGIEFKAKAKP